MPAVQKHRSFRHSAAPASAAVILLLTVACATSTGVVDLSYWRPPGSQTCQVKPPTGDIRALVDSAALADSIAGLDLANGDLLLSVAVDSGEVRRLWRIEDSLLPGDDDRLEDLVARAVADGPGGPARGRVVARIRNGEATELRLSAYQVCPPALSNDWLVGYLLARIQERDRKERVAKVRLSIDTAGRVGGVRVERAPGVEPDTALVRVLEAATFHPALIDRQPVPVRISLDFRGRPDQYRVMNMTAEVAPFR